MKITFGLQHANYWNTLSSSVGIDYSLIENGLFMLIPTAASIYGTIILVITKLVTFWTFSSNRETMSSTSLCICQEILSILTSELIPRVSTETQLFSFSKITVSFAGSFWSKFVALVILLASCAPLCVETICD